MDPYFHKGRLPPLAPPFFTQPLPVDTRCDKQKAYQAEGGKQRKCTAVRSRTTRKNRQECRNRKIGPPQKSGSEKHDEPSTPKVEGSLLKAPTTPPQKPTPLSYCGTRAVRPRPPRTSPTVFPAFHAAPPSPPSGPSECVRTHRSGSRSYSPPSSSVSC